MSLLGSSWTCLLNISLALQAPPYDHVRQFWVLLIRPMEGLALAGHILLSFELLEGKRVMSCISLFPLSSSERRHPENVCWSNEFPDLLSVPPPGVSEYLQRGWIRSRRFHQAVMGISLCSNTHRSQLCKKGSLSFPTCPFVGKNHHNGTARVQELRKVPPTCGRGGEKAAVPGNGTLQTLEPSGLQHKSFSEHGGWQVGTQSLGGGGVGGSPVVRYTVGSGDRRNKRPPAPS